MPCHPHPFTTPFAAILHTTSVLLSEVPGQGAVVRRKAACGIAADNLLTGPALDPYRRAATFVQDSGLTGGRLTAHRVLLGLLPLLIDLRVLPRERVRDRVGFLQLFLHPELIVRFGHVPPDSGPQGVGMQSRAGDGLHCTAG